MPENDADRILRERLARKNAEQKDLVELGKQADEARYREIRREIERLTPQVLALLRQHDYPDMLEIKMRVSGLFRERIVTKAGWRICDYKLLLHGDMVTCEAFLLSDGKISLNYSPGLTPEQLFARTTEVPARYLAGLKSLRNRLEGAR